MASQIPLSLYKRGVRINLGMVQINDDGSIVGQIPSDKWPPVKHLFAAGISELSIIPAPKRTLIPEA